MISTALEIEMDEIPSTVVVGVLVSTLILLTLSAGYEFCADTKIIVKWNQYVIFKQPHRDIHLSERQYCR